MIEEITYHDIVIMPLFVKQMLVIYAWFVEVTNGIIYLLMLHVVIKYSTKEIGAYKWYIVASQSSCVFVFMLKATFEDEPLFPYDVTALGGLADFLPYKTFIIRTFYALFHILHCSHFTCVTLMFMFRYAQTTDRQRMAQFMGSTTVLYYVYFPAWIILIVVANLDAINSIPDAGPYLKRIERVDPKVFAYVEGKPVMIEVATVYNNYIRLIPSFVGFNICAFCTYGCYSYQSQRSDLFSDRTRRLYRSLINVLLIEIAMMFFLVSIPLIFCQEVLEAKHRPLGTALMWRWLFLYPTFTMTFTMTYLGCYRRGLKIIFGRWLPKGGIENSIQRRQSSIHTRST